MNTATLTDRELLAYYRDWCERAHAVSFVRPTSKLIYRFKSWLEQQPEPVLTDYETDFLEAWDTMS